MLASATKPKMPTWDWSKFAGSEPALKYARRDLPTIDKALKLFTGRTACVQAGGCLGIFPKYLARSFTTTYTFEPSVDLFPLLCQNAPEKNILKFQAALGFCASLVGTSQSRRGTKGHRFPHEGITHIPTPTLGGVVPTFRIDDLGLPICDFICLDLEGYELYALNGSLETLERRRPVVMVEINDNVEHYGRSRDDVRAILTSRGYQLSFREHSDEVYVPSEKVAA